MPEGAAFPITPEHAAYARALAPYMIAMSELEREIILRVAFERLGGTPPRVGAVGQAVERLAGVIQDAQQAADMAGRAETLQAADRLARTAPVAPGGAPAATGTLPGLRPAQALSGLPPPGIPGDPLLGGLGLPAPGAPLPRVPFTEAIADALAREPRLATSATEVAQAYSESHVFALARSSELHLTKRVQSAVATAIQEGQSVGEGVASIRKIARAAGADMDRFTRSYAETVFRTNVSTAYTAGRFREMANPAVAFAIGALKFVGPTSTPPQGDTRPNHAAAVGLIAAADDPVWRTMRPPLGYNCRHSVTFVGWPELKRRGLLRPDGKVRRATIPEGAYPDPGFRVGSGAPEIDVYAGAV